MTVVNLGKAVENMSYQISLLDTRIQSPLPIITEITPGAYRAPCTSHHRDHTWSSLGFQCRDGGQHRCYPSHPLVVSSQLKYTLLSVPMIESATFQLLVARPLYL